MTSFNIKCIALTSISVVHTDAKLSGRDAVVQAGKDKAKPNYIQQMFKPEPAPQAQEPYVDPGQSCSNGYARQYCMCDCTCDCWIYTKSTRMSCLQHDVLVNMCKADSNPSVHLCLRSAVIVFCFCLSALVPMILCCDL